MMGPLWWLPMTSPNWTPANITSATVFGWFEPTTDRIDGPTGTVATVVNKMGACPNLTNEGNSIYSLAKATVGTGLLGVTNSGSGRVRTAFSLISQPIEIYTRGIWGADTSNTFWYDGGAAARCALWQQASPRKISLFAGSVVATAHTAPFGLDCVTGTKFKSPSVSATEVRVIGGATYQQSSLAAGTQGIDGLSIAGSYASGQSGGPQVAAMVVVAGELSTEDRARLMTYLAELRGPALLNTVEHGNSLTVGQGATDPATENFTTRMQAHLKPYFALNKLGTSGFTTPQLQAQIVGSVMPLKRTGCVNLLSLWEIGNDMAVNSVTPATAWANAITYKNAAISAGWDGDIAITTLTPRSDLDQVSEIDAVNALIRANAISAGFSHIEDIADHASLQVPAADGIHFNTAQYEIIAQLKAQIRATRYGLTYIA